MFDNLKDIQKKASDLGLELVVVGGAVRDELLFNKSTNDIDIEVHPIKKNESIKTFTDKISKFKEQFSYKDLPFDIFSFSIDSLDLEIGPPRIEYFTSYKSNHSNFTIEISTSREFENLWTRRDFTINAMGYSLYTNNIIDPFGGQLDGENKTLKACGLDFFKDYVRLFRLIRFKILFGFELSSNISNRIDEFVLDDVSFFHLIREGIKSNNLILYLKELDSISRNIEKSTDLSTLIEIFLDGTNELIASTSELEKYIANSKHKEEFIRLLSPFGVISKKRIQKI